MAMQQTVSAGALDAASRKARFWELQQQLRRAEEALNASRAQRRAEQREREYRYAQALSEEPAQEEAAEERGVGAPQSFLEQIALLTLAGEYGSYRRRENMDELVNQLTESYNQEESPVSGSGYDREAALEYALRHDGDPNEAFPNFADPWEKLRYALSRGRNAGTDCANFVSQVLLAGGLPMTDEWSYEKVANEPVPSVVQGYIGTTPYFINPEGNPTVFGWDHRFTGAWARADGLYKYVTDNEDLHFSEITLEGNIDQINAQIEAEKGRIQPGDLLFWDFDRDGTYDHASVVTGWDENDELTYSAHSDTRTGDPLHVGFADKQEVRKLVIVPLKD